MMGRAACQGLARLAGVLVFSCSLGAQAASAPRSITVENDTLGTIKVLAPEGEPERFVIFISDADGLTAPRLAEAETLVARGAAIALIDLVRVKELLSKRTGDTCYYTFGDFEDIARVAQRQLGVTDWRWPIMLGLGEGGTFAYLTLAQAPDNTSGGAVSVGFSTGFPSRHPLCPGAPKASEAKGMISYAPMTDVPGPWVLVAEAEPPANVRAFLDAAAGSSVEVVGRDEAVRFDAAMTALFALKAPVAKGLSDLPLTELAGTGQPQTVLILISGDGGWRDIDKQIGDYLAAHGVAVIGLDSLRYFWTRKEPGQIATDVERIATFYLDKWKLKSVALAGYSFGADAIPAAWPNLSREIQDQTVLIALLGLEPTVDLQVSVSGWLGIANASEIDVRPYLAGLPKSKVLCFFGTDEKDGKETACVFPELDGATRVERPGGHHFDGNYQAVADKILDRLKQP